MQIQNRKKEFFLKTQINDSILGKSQSRRRAFITDGKGERG